MAERKAERKRRAGVPAVVASIVGVCVVALIGVLGVNMGFANARGSASEGFGLGSVIRSTETVVGAIVGSASASSSVSSEATASAASASASNTPSSLLSVTDKQAAGGDSALAKSSTCDISARLNAIAQQREAERLAAEEAARQEEEAAIERALAAQAQSNLDSLEAVDFTVGKAAFVEEWGSRIDAYLSGSPLAGYGSVFAEAAFEYAVDPRFSPAISSVESGKGSACFRAYNAWGWMGTLGSDWDSSIRAHVKGLADGYGYTISMEAAAAYCPPGGDWYAKVLAEMASI